MSQADAFKVTVWSCAVADIETMTSFHAIAALRAASSDVLTQ